MSRTMRIQLGAIFLSPALASAAAPQSSIKLGAAMRPPLRSSRLATRCELDAMARRRLTAKQLHDDVVSLDVF